MASNIIIQAWHHYRGHGLGPLLRGIRRDALRFVPLRHRIAYRRRVARLRFGSDLLSRPLRIHWIDPDRIRRNGPTFHHDKYVGTCLGGDWDRDVVELEDDWMYAGLQQRFADGYDWEETLYYQRSKEKFESGHNWLGYEDFESFETHRLPYLDALYENISEDGYREQSDIDDADRDTIRHSEEPSVSEITCNVGRDGELLLNDGIHRLSIADELELDEIPIQIIARHREWQERRSTIAQSDRPAETTGSYNIDPTHPDIQQISHR